MAGLLSVVHSKHIIFARGRGFCTVMKQVAPHQNVHSRKQNIVFSRDQSGHRHTPRINIFFILIMFGYVTCENYSCLCGPSSLRVSFGLSLSAFLHQVLSEFCHVALRVCSLHMFRHHPWACTQITCNTSLSLSVYLSLFFLSLSV